MLTANRELQDRGYLDQSDSDLLAVLLPTTRIGIPANNIRHFRARQGPRTFGDIESETLRHARESFTETPR